MINSIQFSHLHDARQATRLCSPPGVHAPHQAQFVAISVGMRGFVSGGPSRPPKQQTNKTQPRGRHDLRSDKQRSLGQPPMKCTTRRSGPPTRTCRPGRPFVGRGGPLNVSRTSRRTFTWSLSIWRTLARHHLPPPAAPRRHCLSRVLFLPPPIHYQHSLRSSSRGAPSASPRPFEFRCLRGNLGPLGQVY